MLVDKSFLNITVNCGCYATTVQLDTFLVIIPAISLFTVLCNDCCCSSAHRHLPLHVGWYSQHFNRQRQRWLAPTPVWTFWSSTTLWRRWRWRLTPQIHCCSRAWMSWSALNAAHFPVDQVLNSLCCVLFVCKTFPIGWALFQKYGSFCDVCETNCCGHHTVNM